MTKTSHHTGFTLIEVLIALVIVAIALMAIVKATSYDVEDATTIQQRTIAHWVGMHTITSIQLGLFKPPLKNETTKMLGEKWYWSATLGKTADTNVEKIDVSVSNKLNGKPIAKLQAFKEATTQ